MKTLKILAAAGMLLVTFQAYSQQTKTVAAETAKESGQFVPGRYVDKDDNGICDNFEMRRGMSRNPGFTDKNNDGICDNYAQSQGRGKGPGFTDKDGDGICDHRQGNFRGRHGYGHGRHHGGQCCGRSMGYGRR